MAKYGNKTTSWSDEKYRMIRGEARSVQTRYVNGKEEIKILQEDLKRERNGELDKEIPFGKARKDFRRKADDPERDKQFRAKHTFTRPNKRWDKDMAHYDVETIDTPK